MSNNSGSEVIPAAKSAQFVLFLISLYRQHVHKHVLLHTESFEWSRRPTYALLLQLLVT